MHDQVRESTAGSARTTGVAVLQTPKESLVTTQNWTSQEENEESVTSTAPLGASKLTERTMFLRHQKSCPDQPPKQQEQTENLELAVQAVVGVPHRSVRSRFAVKL